MGLRTMTLAMALATALTSSASASTPKLHGYLRSDFDYKTNTLIIKDDGGGNVGLYQRRVNFAIRHKQKVRIEGLCASACTLFLYVPNYCVAPDAKLWFHSPFITLGGTRYHLKSVADWMITQYPPTVRTLLEKSGGLQVEWTKLEGEEMQMSVRTCE